MGVFSCLQVVLLSFDWPSARTDPFSELDFSLIMILSVNLEKLFDEFHKPCSGARVCSVHTQVLLLRRQQISSS